MNKRVALLLLCLAPLLTGCGLLSAERREVEELRLVETMGLDPAGDGLLLSLSSSGTGEEGPRSYCGAGPSLNQAMESLRSRSPGEQLFCGHLQTILVGEAYARAGMESLLSAVCRSTDLRLDMPLYLILDGSARDAVCRTGDGEKGVGALLSAMKRSREQAGGLSSAGAILRDLNGQGSSLLRALRLQDGSREDGEDLALVPAGYAVLVRGRLAGLISPENAPAAELLTDSLCPCVLNLRDGQGRSVSLELQEGSCRLLPLWDEEGTLTGLEIRLSVRAVVQELEDFRQVADQRYLNELTARMEAELTRRVGAVLQLSRELEADFLGLGRRLEPGAPLRGRGLSQSLGPLLPGLSLRLSLRGELLHSNDIN